MDIITKMQEKQEKKERMNKIILKLVYIGILSIVLLIPATLINQLVIERKNLQQNVTSEIFSKWAGKQKITGPLLIIPYTESYQNQKGEIYQSKKHIYYLPNNLEINGNIIPEIRYRSIYKVPVYSSNLRISGDFDGLPFEKLGIVNSQIDYNQIQLVLGISDYKGLKDAVILKWDETEQEMSTDFINNQEITTGLGGVIKSDSISILKNHAFSISLNLNGSESFSFIAAGRNSIMNLNSPWKSPEFNGDFLPETRTINENGFSAQWKVASINRKIPPFWNTGDYIDSYEKKLENTEAEMGFSLLQSINTYSLTLRIVKYAFLVIVLTFSVSFFIELFQKKNIHFLQYTLIGFALCIFYLLLLSLGEYVNFLTAYTISSLSIILLISSYMGAILKSLKTAFSFAFFMTILYGFVYLLIQMKEFALLAGSISLFIIIALAMYLSIKLKLNLSPPIQEG